MVGYHRGAGYESLLSSFSFVILLQIIVPIALYISLEFVRLLQCQLFLNNDSQMRYTGPTSSHQSEEEKTVVVDTAVTDSPSSLYYESQGVELVQVAVNETLTVSKRNSKPQINVQSPSSSLDKLLPSTRDESFRQPEDTPSAEISEVTEVTDQTSKESKSDICINFQARAWNINEDLGQVEPLKVIGGKVFLFKM